VTVRHDGATAATTDYTLCAGLATAPQNACKLLAVESLSQFRCGCKFALRTTAFSTRRIVVVACWSSWVAEDVSQVFLMSPAVLLQHVPVTLLAGCRLSSWRVPGWHEAPILLLLYWHLAFVTGVADASIVNAPALQPKGVNSSQVLASQNLSESIQQLQSKGVVHSDKRTCPLLYGICSSMNQQAVILCSLRLLERCLAFASSCSSSCSSH
jgi:hypothetical protein